MACKVHFWTTCSETRPGWHVRVVGSCPALGRWDPRQGVPLATTAGDFPVWKAGSAVSLDEHAAVEYKYVICDDAVETVRWENTPNRGLHVASLAECGGCAATVAEAFGVVLRSDRLRLCALPRPGTAAGAWERAGSSRSPERTRPRAAEQGRCLGLPPPAACERRRSAKALALAAENAGGSTPSLVREEGGADWPHNTAAEVAGISQSFQRHYSLVGDEALGEGSFGIVWRCAARVGGPERAAKVVWRGGPKAQGRQFLLDEDEEISIHMTLRHRHVVAFLEYFAEEQSLTLVLECCAGGDLFDAVIRHAGERHRGLAPHQAAVAAQHTLLAVAYLHGRCIVHRDIKCENVLLSRAGVPLERNVFKLCDLGLAAHDWGDGLTDRVGSADTVAPEVVVGPSHSFPADLWSVGTLVYMMLSARTPFKGDTDEEVLMKVSMGRYSLSGAVWAGVPAPPKHVITCLMVVDANLRPTAKEALRKAWFHGVPAAALTK